MRITSNGSMYMYKNNLTNVSNSLYSAMNKVLSKRNFDTYSANPSGATRAFNIHSSLNATNTQAANNKSVLSKFETAWSIEDQVLNELSHDLAEAPALGGLNGTNLDSLQSYSQIIRSGADAIVQSMNGKYADQFIFNGAETGEPPFAIETDSSQDPPTDCLTFRGWRVDIPDNDTAYVDLEGKYVYVDKDGKEITIPEEFLNEDGTINTSAPDYAGSPYEEAGAHVLTNAEALDNLEEMAGESLFVDIGLSFELDEDGGVIDSTAFDSSLSGLNFLGFGTDEDGDPKNIVSIMLKVSDIFAGYEHNKDNPENSTWGDAGNYDDAVRLTSKFTKAQGRLSEEHTSLGAQATYLETNQERLEDTYFNLNSERSTIEDCDPADAITAYLAANTCYQAALQVGTNVIPQSLMDYLQ